LPDLGAGARPAMRSRRDVFPEPDGPKIIVTWAVQNCRFKPSRGKPGPVGSEMFFESQYHLLFLPRAKSHSLNPRRRQKASTTDTPKQKAKRPGHPGPKLDGFEKWKAEERGQFFSRDIAGPTHDGRAETRQSARAKREPAWPPTIPPPTPTEPVDAEEYPPSRWRRGCRRFVEARN